MLLLSTLPIFYQNSELEENEWDTIFNQISPYYDDFRVFLFTDQTVY